VCGRYALSLAGKLDELPFTEDSVQLELELPWECYNISPGTQAPILDSDGFLRLSLWGLIPHWSKTPPKRPLFNARSETADSKPSFRTAYKNHRCAVPASGYFEWEKIDRKTRHPYYISSRSGHLLWLAGLASTWKDQDGRPLSTFCVLTQSSDGSVVESLHHRCPVALQEHRIQAWVKGECSHQEAKADDVLRAPFRVSMSVNHARNDNPSNIQPIS
jgi:putative SOS response-associated peptidase YedK